MRLLVFILFFMSTLFAFNVKLSSNKIENGKTVYVEFEKDENIKYKSMTLNKKTYKVFDNPVDTKRMYALLPISYYEKPMHKNIEVNYKYKGKTFSKNISMDIKNGNYERETITVSKSKVNPTDKAVKKRISKEYNEAMKIYKTINNESYITSKFIMPMDSKITSSFGKARIYNNTLNGYHSGTDFRAKVGTPIIASNDGVVVLVKKRFYSGGTVIIDHGEGIYTCYFHMSKFMVKKDQRVKKADEIGLSGQSGRVTGPHLHFSVRVSGVQVEPLQLISLLNKNLFKDKK